MSKRVCYNKNKMKRKIRSEHGLMTDFKFNVYIIFSLSHSKSINYKFACLQVCNSKTKLQKKIIVT